MSTPLEMPAAPMIVSRTEAPLSTTFAAEMKSAVEYARAERSDKTRKTYRGEWKAFVAWCAERALSPLPATGEAVAISQAHRLAGLDSPRKYAAVERVRKGIRRKLGTAQKGRTPLLLEQLRRMCAELPADAAGDRDRALLLLGWAAMMRRSEIAALEVGDVREVPEGLEVTLRHGKTDQEGAGGLSLSRPPRARTAEGRSRLPQVHLSAAAA